MVLRVKWATVRYCINGFAICTQLSGFNRGDNIGSSVGAIDACGGCVLHYAFNIIGDVATDIACDIADEDETVRVDARCVDEVCGGSGAWWKACYPANSGSTSSGRKVEVTVGNYDVLIVG